MCGVVGYFASQQTLQHRVILKNLIDESSIRGIHAFGAVIRNSETGQLSCHKYHVKQDMSRLVGTADFNMFVGHNRYDTSGDWRQLANNQPLCSRAGDFDNYLSFNGVIRMTTKAEYEQEFGRTYRTDNDGEIILDLLSEIGGTAKANEILQQPAVSFAGIALIGGQPWIYRNERRPLYIISAFGAVWVTSTMDIFNRAIRRSIHKEFVYKIRPVPPNAWHNLYNLYRTLS